MQKVEGKGTLARDDLEKQTSTGAICRKPKKKLSLVSSEGGTFGRRQKNSGEEALVIVKKGNRCGRHQCKKKKDSKGREEKGRSALLEERTAGRKKKKEKEGGGKGPEIREDIRAVRTVGRKNRGRGATFR